MVARLPPAGEGFSSDELSRQQWQFKNKSGGGNAPAVARAGALPPSQPVL